MTRKTPEVRATRMLKRMYIVEKLRERGVKVHYEIAPHLYMVGCTPIEIEWGRALGGHKQIVIEIEGKTITEPEDAFPSSTLVAQLMLIAG